MGFSSGTSNSNGQSQGTSAAYNQAYPSIQKAYGSQMGLTGESNNAIMSLLGLRGDDGQAKAFQNYKDSTNYNFIRNQGMDGINSNNAARGLLGSGDALKAISGYNTNMASNFFDNYLSKLQGVGTSGLQSGQLVTQAGNTSNSQNTAHNTSQGSNSSISLS